MLLNVYICENVFFIYNSALLGFLHVKVMLVNMKLYSCNSVQVV